MNYEFQDYRQPKKHDPGPWLTWSVPSHYCLRYLFRLALWLWLIPLILFGGHLSSFGIALQFFVVDFFTWIQYKNTNTI